MIPQKIGDRPETVIYMKLFIFFESYDPKTKMAQYPKSLHTSNIQMKLKPILTIFEQGNKTKIQNY